MPIYKSLLPAEYQEVEYIESTGTQYIDTGFVPTNESKLDITSSLTNTGTLHDGCLSGTRNTTANQFVIWFNDNSGTPNISPRFRAYNIASVNVQYDTKINCIFDKNGAIINGTTYSLTTQTGLNLSTYNLLIFALNNTGSVDNRMFTGKLYSCQLYDNGTIVRNFVPCYRKSDSVIGLYDTVNKVFYTNQGTGTFLKGNDAKPRQVKSIYKGSTKIIKRYKGTDVIYRVLPSAYQEVEYIESSGTQYIDSGFLPNQDTRMVTNLSVSQFETSLNTVPFGSRYSVNDKNYGITFGGNAISGYFKKLYSGFGNDNVSNGAIILQTDVIYNFDKNKNILYLDNAIAISNTDNLFTSVYNIYLFALNQKDTPAFNSYIKLYSCKLYDNGTIVRDFVPCYRKSDNVIGLYDLVNGVFYTNAGTGTFLKGGNVL